MRLVLRYVEKTKAGGWQYRRRVPSDLSSVILKREFKAKLGDTERQALAAYPAFHATIEREISEARSSQETPTFPHRVALPTSKSSRRGLCVFRLWFGQHRPPLLMGCYKASLQPATNHP